MCAFAPYSQGELSWSAQGGPRQPHWVIHVVKSRTWSFLWSRICKRIDSAWSAHKHHANLTVPTPWCLIAERNEGTCKGASRTSRSLGWVVQFYKSRSQPSSLSSKSLRETSNCPLAWFFLLAQELAVLPYFSVRDSYSDIAKFTKAWSLLTF